MRNWVLAGMLLSFQAQANILPENNLHLQDGLFQTDMTEAQFNAIIDSVAKHYEPVVTAFGGKLVLDRNWKSSTVNAYAQQSGSNWKVSMFGGLARRPEVTPDGFALVMCHELGHHIAGYPFYSDSKWAATEGESDYFATQTCARVIWSQDKDENAKARDSVDSVAQAACDRAWADVGDRDLCYRVANASHSLAKLLAALGGKDEPKFDTPDTQVVSKTYEAHPKAQCRLDTYFQGGLCVVGGPSNIIPGKQVKDGRNSPAAEEEALQYSCKSGDTHGVRPSCWFKSKLAI